MHEISKAAVRVAGLLAMALFVAHCGDSSVHIRTSGGRSPSAGTFTGVTDEGGTITIQVGSIEGIAFECDGEDISGTFSPPKTVNGDGSFDFRFSDGGREFHVTGTFSDNDNASGVIDDDDNRCDTGFEASRSGVTRTPTPVSSNPTPTTTGEPVSPTVTVGTPGPTDTGPTSSGGTTPTPTPTGSATCPNLITFTGTSTGPALDTGWTGFGHDATVVSGGTVTVTATCGSSTPPCGVCNYSGPVANAAGLLPSQRCSNDSSIHCTSNTPCTPGGGTCKFFFGTYLPLAAGGVATCVENTFNGGISGTANIESGASGGTALLTARVYNAIVGLGQPCPRCIGDPTANDGVMGGTCDAGTRSGLACDANGSSPFTSTWGTTSLDCPLNFATGGIASLPIDLTNTTGTKTRTLTAANPNCRGAGFTSLKCQCDTCNDNAQEPCSQNADCPDPPGPIGPICGGKRCIGGTNDGAACITNTECPGGGASCNVPGAATVPNQCDDATCTDGVCAAGPPVQTCAPTETYKGCTVDGDCAFPGDTCSGGGPRSCFDNDNGAIGDTVTATGHADTPVNHASNPTLAALFCVGPTSSGSVNGAAGLPGLGRLVLTGHATDNGTP
jgi:hypothetical protein